MNILVVLGTVVEAIKMSQLLRHFAKFKNIDARLCITGRHKKELEHICNLFEIKADYKLNIVELTPNPSEITRSILKGLNPIFDDFAPDIIIVHGASIFAFAASLAAHYRDIPIGHVDAGLRTGNVYFPWSEEYNSKLIRVLAKLHFAPTTSCVNNLLQEGVKRKCVSLTGNTAIDTLLWSKQLLDNNTALERRISSSFPFLRNNARLILITGWHHESLDYGFEEAALAVCTLALKYPEIDFVYQAHLKSKALKCVDKSFKRFSNIHLIKPQNYLSFVWLMRKAYLIITNSGGIQEEVPSLGKPVLVMRDTTEYYEAIKVGTSKLVGTTHEHIIFGVMALLSNQNIYDQMATSANPYGKGNSSSLIVKTLLNWKNDKQNF